MATTNLKTIDTANTVTAATSIDYSKKVAVDGSAIFPGLFPQGVNIPMFANRHPAVPSSSPFYAPDPRVFRSAMKWMLAKRRQIGFGLWGETRTGKTELVRYLADKLNWPVQFVSCHSDFRPYQLEGQNKLVDGATGVVTQFDYAAAAIAYKEGHILLLDEVDKLSPEVTAKLHLLAEGKPWPIDETGEVINPHPNFRLFGTANTNGSGTSDRYLSSSRMDEAFRRRWGWVKTSFLTAEQENEILMAVTNNKLPLPLILKMTQTASELRKLLKSDTPISTVVGTGTLTQWAEWIIEFGKKSPIQESLDFCLLNGTDEDELPDIEACLQRIWGNDLSRTLGDWMTGGKASSAKK